MPGLRVLLKKWLKMRIPTLRTCLLIFTWAFSLQIFAQLDPKNLPSLETYKGRVKLAFELEAQQEALSKIIRFFEVPGVSDDLPDELRAAAVLEHPSLIRQMTVKKDAPKDLKKARFFQRSKRALLRWDENNLHSNDFP